MVSKMRERQLGNEAWAFCSLDGDERLQRLALVRAKVMPHVRGQEELVDGFAWECADDPMSRAHIEELVRLESACCGGLQLTLRDLPERAAIRFEARGPDLPAAQLDALRSLGRVGSTARLVKAGGRPPRQFR